MAKKKTRKKGNETLVENETFIYIYSLLIIALSLIGILEVGIVGKYLTLAVRYLVGHMYAIFYLFLIILSFLFMKDKNLKKFKIRFIIGIIVFVVAWLILCAVPSDQNLIGMDVVSTYMDNSKAILNNELSAGGGLIGAFLYGLSSLLFGRLGTFIVVSFLIILGFLLLISGKVLDQVKSYFADKKAMIQKRKNEKERKKELDRVKKELSKKEDLKSTQLSFIEYEEKNDIVSNSEENSINTTNKKNSLFINVDDVTTFEKDVMEKEPVKEIESKQVIKEEVKEETLVENKSKYLTDFKNYRLPSIRLLNLGERKNKSNTNMLSASEKGEKLVSILSQFGVNVTLVDTHIGPSVTKFELRPDLGVRVNRISNLQQDIKMGLAAKDIRIEAPIPGKSTVGVEIPNEEKLMVPFRDLMKNVPKEAESKKLMFALGKDLMGNCVYGELNKMPHLLVAGATGSGKSVCMNTIICSILMRTKPDEVKMVLIDPKKVEFTQYAKIPHLMAPVITNGEEASRALKVVVKIMDDRYELFSQLGVRNIAGYNSYLKSHPEEQLKPMPYIMVVIDELADLMLVAAKEVEGSIQRITQLARAAGIHMIVATQRPSVDVITGVIKSNIPSRIAFRVSSQVDSRTILDQNGAERLLGFGDMLYVPQDEQVAIRVQGCYVDDEEVNAICEFCSQQALPRYDDIFLRLEECDNGSGSVSEFNDPLYEEVKNFVIESGKASTSFVQRKFSIGYARAARLIDTLEAQGVIGPSRGSKPREVYVRSNVDES